MKCNTRKKDKGRGDTGSGSGSGGTGGLDGQTAVKETTERNKVTSEETLDRIPKAAVQLLTEQFLENVDKSHLLDSCQGYGWDGSALEGLGAVSVDECERAIQERSKQWYKSQVTRRHAVANSS